MGIDPLSLGIGLASGFVTSFLGNLSYNRFKSWRLRKKRDAGAYVTVTHPSGSFEGYVDETRDSDIIYSCDGVCIKISVNKSTGRARIPAEEIHKKLLEALGSELKGEDKPKLIDSVEVEQKREGKSSK